MPLSICGLDCGACSMKDQCGGCTETGGKPFGGTCMIALCCEYGENGTDPQIVVLKRR